MKEVQVVKFWEALDASTSEKEVISSFENKPGYDGKRNLMRYAQVHRGFKQKVSSVELAKITGWKEDTIKKFKSWWDKKFASTIKEPTKFEPETPIISKDSSVDNCFSSPEGIYVTQLTKYKIPEKQAIKLLVDWNSYHSNGKHDYCLLYGNLIKDLEIKIPWSEAMNILDTEIYGKDFGINNISQQMNIVRTYRPSRGLTNLQTTIKEIRNLNNRKE
jgi:hypothetical protein